MNTTRKTWRRAMLIWARWNLRSAALKKKGHRGPLQDKKGVDL